MDAGAGSFGHRLLAASVVVVPILLGINALLHPPVEMSGAGLLAGAARNATLWYVVHMSAALGGLLVIPSAFGLRSLVRNRGRRVADFAAAAAVIGGGILALTFAAEASVLRLAVTALDAGSAEALADAYTRSPEFFAVPVGIVGACLGGLLMGLALMRSGQVPRWAGGLYAGGWAASLVAAPGSPIGPVAYGALLAAAMPLGVRVAAGPATGEGRGASASAHQTV